jgi:hypothetical protein
MPLSLSILDIYGYEIENVTGRNENNLSSGQIIKLNRYFRTIPRLR